MKNHYSFAAVDEGDLDQLMAGHEIVPAVSFGAGEYRPPVKNGQIGVLWRKIGERDVTAQPLLLVAHDEDLRRLCGRYAQLRSDLAPLTSWCHLFTPERFQLVNELTREPDLSDLQAAWAGLVVAEALLLSELPIANVRIPACLATQTFAMARAIALWGNIDLQSIRVRHDSAARLFRSEPRDDARVNRISGALLPIWTALSCMSGADRNMRSAPGELEAILSSLEALKLYRAEKGEGPEARAVLRPLISIMPISEELLGLDGASAEVRVQFFDSVVSTLENSAKDAPWTRAAMTLVAGYIVTVAAGGTASLTMAERVARRWPEITAWAYVLGSIGERVTWSSAFDGLGRLVSRELMRKARFDEPPPCDFALDEASILADRALSDPLVHLRIKQARVVSVALLPGVYVSVAIGEQPTATGRASTYAHPETAPAGNILAALADALWPYFESKVKASRGLQDGSDSQSRSKSGKRQGSQTQLPWSDSRRKS